MGKLLLSVLAPLCAMAFLGASTSPSSAERRVALVIGNSAYQNVVRLDNPANDATAMADMFKAAGFDVVDLRKDLGVVEFKRAIREFFNTTRNADMAVVYYAGHGIEVGGTNYMVPVDAKLASDFDARDEAVELERLAQVLEPARGLRLIILDACRDNPFVRKMQRTVALRSIGNGLAKVEPTEPNTLVAYAAKAGSTAEDGNTGHSPFTTALLKNLTTPGLDVRLAFGRVRDDVLKLTGNRQEPFVYGSLGGATISLVPAPEPKKVEAPVTASTGADMRAAYEAAERVGTVAAWDSFLSVYSTGFYAELAKAQRSKLGTAVAALSPERSTPIKRPGETEAITPDRAAWERIKDTDDPAALRNFIKRFPASPLALTAQSRLDALERAAAQRREEEDAARQKAEEERRAKIAAEAERQRAERDAARQRQEEERKAKAEQAARLKAERERQEEEKRARLAAVEREKAEREAAQRREAEAAAEKRREELACKRDEEKLARLRASHNRDELGKLEQGLACERLRPEVVAALEAAAAEAAKAAARAAEPDSPELVRSAQKELRRLGCYAGRETGALDDNTRHAVAGYLSRSGKPSADIKITEGLVSELKQQASIESCIATPEQPKTAPVAHGGETSKPSGRREEKAERSKPEPKSRAAERHPAKREAAPRREERQAAPRREAPRARAEAAAAPRPSYGGGGGGRGGGGTMTGVGF